MVFVWPSRCGATGLFMQRLKGSTSSIFVELATAVSDGFHSTGRLESPDEERSAHHFKVTRCEIRALIGGVAVA